MENKPVMAAGPHIHSADSSRRIMLDVIIALLPASIAAVVLFGLQAALMICVCVAAAVVSEFLFNLIARRDQSVGDLSAVVTGLLLALNLSTNVPLWQCALGSVFAIVLVKCAFGGMGHNFANPAITARIFLLMAFTSTVAGGAMPRLVDAVSSATPLDLIGTEGAELPTLGQMFLGLRGGAIGEGCILALLIGFAYLLARKVIHWQTPVIFMGTVFVCFLISSGSFSVALYELLAGGLVLGAVFMATDYTTTPITAEGRMLFALGCGLLTFVIRRFCSLPEGVSYSILCMNILSPWLEKWTRRKPLGGV
ncbi:MAG: RnfABCDGE type electron transport complex subunit D [Oscillospiraceae bacterium]|nr:RnfABCDGE type electron transport complex subunit D [Oscillospiraceae bacterium]